MSQLIAKRYAKAFFELSKDQKILDEAHEDLEKTGHACEDSQELTRLLKSPIVSRIKQQDILTGLFEKKIHKNTLKFLLFLAVKHRLNLLTVIIEEFKNLYLNHQNILTITITTRDVLSKDLKESFLTSLNKKFHKSVNPIWNVDSKILGGFRIQARDHVEDYSLQNQLNQLEKELINN